MQKEKIESILVRLSKFNIKAATIHTVHSVPKNWKVEYRPAPCNHFRFKTTAPKINKYPVYRIETRPSQHFGALDILEALEYDHTLGREAFCLRLTDD